MRSWGFLWSVDCEYHILFIIYLHYSFQLMLMMFSSASVCIASILRTLQVEPYEKSPDWTWYGPMFMFWHVIEVDLAIMVNSAPAIKPLLMSEVNRVRDLVSTVSRSRAGNEDLENGDSAGLTAAVRVRPTLPKRESSRRVSNLRQSGVRELERPEATSRWTPPRPISDVSMKAISPMPSIPDATENR